MSSYEFKMGYLEFGMLGTGMSSGPAIWDFGAHFNLETVGAQSHVRVRERMVRIKYYSQLSHLSRIKDVTECIMLFCRSCAVM